MVSMSQSGLVDEGTVIITDNQTMGRGQAGNKWVSEPGANLTFSVLFKPTFLEPTQQFYLNMAVGLGICDALNTILDGGDLPIQLKWPNDILIADKKVCGILIENQVQGQSFSQTVVGIGLNVNQERFEWPGVASLKSIAEHDFDRTSVLETLLEKLEARYVQLKQRNLDQLKADYYSILYRLDEQHEFSSDGRTFSGMVKGIDEVGRLLLRVDGEVVSFNFKEIRFIQ
jgi:BirA family biotin operon repressor/biotin-[acetyl-CoA-carboxylase] ligase